jgi:hypothetical protein
MESYYSTWEMADMHFMYGCAIGDSQEARRLYCEYYPQCRIPSHKLFPKLHQQLSKSGSLAPRALIMEGLNQFEILIWKFMGSVEDHPRTSVQRIAAAEKISVSLVWRILHEQHLTTSS